VSLKRFTLLPPLRDTEKVSPLASTESEARPATEEVITMRRTEGTFAAELSILRLPWTAGRTISFSGSAPCRTIIGTNLVQVIDVYCLP
jgi:hypothetical protein